MTDDSELPPWFNPALFTKQMQEASQDVAESQQELFAQLLRANSSMPFGDDSPADLGSLFDPRNSGPATFKARIQSGGRISVPEPEREALDIQEGDIVQTIIVPVKRAADENDEDASD